MIKKKYYYNRFCTVSFALSDYGQSDPPDLIIPIGGLVVKPETPYDAHCTFLYWYYTDESGNDIVWNFSTDRVTQDIELSAAWDCTTLYSVKYSKNGGFGEVPMSKTYDEGLYVEVLFPSRSLSKNGCEFECWNTNSDGTGTTYYPGSGFYINSNVVLYAQFNSSTATLTLINKAPSYGTLTKSPDNLTYDVGTVVACTATPKNGGTFSRFFVDGVDKGGQFNTINITMDTSHTCEALFIESPVTTLKFLDCNLTEHANYMDLGGKCIGIKITDNEGYSFIVALNEPYIPDLSIPWGDSNNHNWTTVPDKCEKSYDTAIINNRDGDLLQAALYKDGATNGSKAAKCCHDYSPSTCSGATINWRLPTCYELLCMASVIDGLNRMISNVGGLLIVKTYDTKDPNNPERAYWSSEYIVSDGNNPWKMYFEYGNLGYLGDYRFTKNDNYIRPVATFSNN